MLKEAIMAIERNLFAIHRATRIEVDISLTTLKEVAEGLQAFVVVVFFQFDLIGCRNEDIFEDTTIVDEKIARAIGLIGLCIILIPREIN